MIRFFVYPISTPQTKCLSLGRKKPAQGDSPPPHYFAVFATQATAFFADQVPGRRFTVPAFVHRKEELGIYRAPRRRPALGHLLVAHRLMPTSLPRPYSLSAEHPRSLAADGERANVRLALPLLKPAITSPDLKGRHCNHHSGHHPDLEPFVIKILQGHSVGNLPKYSPAVLPISPQN